MTIPDRIKKMQDPQGFYELWLEEVRKGKSYKQAYHAIKAEYKAFIKDNNLQELRDANIVKGLRYSSYDSFRINGRMRKICVN